MQVQITINVKGSKSEIEDIVFGLTEYISYKEDEIGDFSELDYIDIEVIRTKPYNPSI
jgi:hypothetical protein